MSVEAEERDRIVEAAVKRAQEQSSGDWGVVHVLKGYLREYIRVKYVFESLFLVRMYESDMSPLRRTYGPSTVPTEHPSKREAGCPFLG
jgi:hypothetical protein